MIYHVTKSQFYAILRHTTENNRSKNTKLFSKDESLRHIATGATSDDANPDMTEDIGNNILKSMAGVNVYDFSFKKRDQVKTINNKHCIKVDGDALNVDPQ